MSILKDILDAKKDMKDIVKEIGTTSKKSIARSADPGVMQFPGLFSSGISLEDCSMISKALEREYVTFISIITSINSITDEKDIESYLARIHQNDKGVASKAIGRELLGESTRLPIGYKDMVMSSENAAINVLESLSEGCKQKITEDDAVVGYDELEDDEKEIFDEACNKASKRIKNEAKNCSGAGKCFRESYLKSTVIDAGESFRHVMALKNIETGQMKIVETNSFITSKEIPISEATKIISKKSMVSLQEYTSQFNESILNEAKKESYKKYDPNKDYGKIRDEIIQKGADDRQKDDNTQTNQKTDFGSYNKEKVFKDVFKDSDVKKANELMPTMLHLNTFFRDNNGGLQAVDYLIGVKLVAHKIDSDEMVENLAKATKRGKAFFKLMKLTTGEISFFKDFLLAIDEIKDDVKSKWVSSPWWNSLRRRRQLGAILRRLNFKQQLVPNASIIITMDDVEKCKMEHQIDLMNTRTVLDVMNQLYLLSFVIVDPSVETVYFMFDGRTNFETFSYAALERENSNSKREVQNVMQVLGKM